MLTATAILCGRDDIARPETVLIDDDEWECHGDFRRDQNDLGEWRPIVFRRHRSSQTLYGPGRFTSKAAGDPTVSPCV